MTATVTRLPRATKRQRKRLKLTCPAYITGLARLEWRRITSLPAASRLLGAENRALVEAYVLTYARWRALEAEVAETGAISTAPKTGTPMYAVCMTLAQKERAALLRLADALGLTPRTRGQVEPAAAEGGDDWQGLIA